MFRLRVRGVCGDGAAVSMTLYWIPVKTNYKFLPDALKFVLRKRYGGHVDCQTIGDEEIPYLNALVDAGIDGASDLIDAIEKHGYVEIGEK